MIGGKVVVCVVERGRGVVIGCSSRREVVEEYVTVGVAGREVEKGCSDGMKILLGGGILGDVSSARVVVEKQRKGW